MHCRTEVIVTTFQTPLGGSRPKLNMQNRRLETSAWDSLRRFISDGKEVLRYLILDGSVALEWQRDGLLISRKPSRSVLSNSR